MFDKKNVFELFIYFLSFINELLSEATKSPQQYNAVKFSLFLINLCDMLNILRLVTRTEIYLQKFSLDSKQSGKAINHSHQETSFFKFKPNATGIG